MELKDKSTAASDDEDDLEKLRLAALQSLKRTVPDETKKIPKNLNKHTQNIHKRRNFQGRNPRNGQFYNRQKNTNLISIPTVSDEPIARDVKNHNKSKFCDDSVHKLILPQDRYCNTNALIEKPAEPSSKFDRYDNSDKSESESECDHKSDSESESPGKLEKASSLEALMQELENEIQGESKPKEEKVVKSNKSKKRKQKVSVSDTVKENASKGVKAENIVENNENDKLGKELSVENKDIENEGKESVRDAKKDLSKTKLDIDSKRSPLNKKFYKRYHPDRNLHKSAGFLPHQPYAPPVIYPESIHFNQSLPFNQVMPYNNNVVLEQSLHPLSVPLTYNHPPVTTTAYDRPPSPLSLNADDVLTITRAPLSPRSAAFVLQNREIIERRKKSPRRSYSRSPSPRYRRSKSPPNYGRSNRSPSPRKFVKSKSRSPYPSTSDLSRKLSPCKDKLDPIRDKRTPPLQDRRSPLPRNASPLRDRRSPMRNRISPLRQRYPERRSPNSRRTSPVTDRSPKANFRNSPKTSVRERLGNKTNRPNPNAEQTQANKARKRSRSLSLSPEPEENKEKIHKNEKEAPLDPILEARRRKFETNEIKNVEGIIRLRPKTENSPENESDNASVPNPPEQPAIANKIDDMTPEESELMDLLNTKVDDIFSDEETDEENEGRFKSNLNKPQRNVSILPFTQLLDDSKRNIKTDLLKSTNQNTRNSEKDRSSDRSRKRQRSRSPLRNKEIRNYKDRSKNDSDTKTDHSSRSKTAGKEKLYAKSRILFRNGSTSRKEKLPVTAPIESKKIEIKIRNPSKYETISKYDVANEYETLERLEKTVRKVEVSDAKKESDVEISDAEIINENEEFEGNADAHLNQKCEAAGDLRAQLSRKRAERQNKLPVPEDVQSRLLQNALQGAVFKKPKKSKKEKDSAPKEYAAVKRTATVTNLGYGIMKIKSNKFLPGDRKVRFLYSDKETIGNFTDGKLPIHLRLGFANSMDIFQEKNTKRKRSKSKGRIEQV